MINNAMLTDVFAIADAWLEAGWVRGQTRVMAEGRHYPVAVCLGQALYMGACEVEEQGSAAMELYDAAVERVAAELPGAWRVSPGLCRHGLIAFNDNAPEASQEKVRELIHRAVEKLRGK